MGKNIDHVYGRLEAGLRYVLDNPTEEAMGDLLTEIKAEIKSCPDINYEPSSNYWHRELLRLVNLFVRYPSVDDYHLLIRRCTQYMELVAKDTFTPIRLGKPAYINDLSLWDSQELNARMYNFIGTPGQDKLRVLTDQMDKILSNKESA